MRIRQAKKIMKHRSGCLYYELMRSKGLDVSKELPKIQQYWQPRWALCIAIEHSRCGRKDHRITKAQILSLRKDKRA